MVRLAFGRGGTNDVTYDRAQGPTPRGLKHVMTSFTPTPSASHPPPPPRFNRIFLRNEMKLYYQCEIQINYFTSFSSHFKTATDSGNDSIAFIRKANNNWLYLN